MIPLPSIPIIGITTRLTTNSTPPADAQNASYTKAIIQAGGAPILIPIELTAEATLRTVYLRTDGILIPGGSDIDPACYRQPRHSSVSGVQPDRDGIEITLIRWAVQDNKPLLGICRGIQAMAVAMGGSLHQDIVTDLPQAIRHNYYADPAYGRDFLAHPVTLDPASLLAATIIGNHHFPVNSLHHQAINQLPPIFRAVGHSQDGIIEAIESPAHTFLCGVQWHPEELITDDEPSRRIFAAFVKACIQGGML